VVFLFGANKATDMYLYAHLAIEHLLQQPDKETLLEKIKEEVLPKELSQMCDLLLVRSRA